MKDVNKVIVVGRLGGNPVQRQTKTGTVVVNFSVATSYRVLDENSGSPNAPSYSDETQWHKVVVWGRQGEACSQYLRKGHPVYVEGSIRSHDYESKDGKNRTSFEIYAETVSFLGSPSAERETLVSNAGSLTA